MLTAAKPYAMSALTAHGLWSEHMYADPPSHPDAALASLRGESSLEQVLTGLETSALPGHEQEPAKKSDTNSMTDRIQV